MLTPENIVMVVLSFGLGGLVKGAIGMGLPVVVLAMLVLVMPLRDAMAVFIIPSILTNFLQAVTGPWLVELLRRLWSFLGAAIIGIGFGVFVLAGTPTGSMVMVMGILLSIYAVYALIAPRLPAPGRHEGWMSPVMGGVGGIFFGMAGLFIIPAILYLETLRIDRDRFVQALGLTFLTISVSLGVFMTGFDLVSGDLFILSMLGILPVIAGFTAGRLVRGRISEEIYRRWFLIALFATGIFMIVRTYLSGLSA